jgi:hypothetical protein
MLYRRRADRYFDAAPDGHEYEAPQQSEPKTDRPVKTMHVSRARLLSPALQLRSAGPSKERPPNSTFSSLPREIYGLFLNGKVGIHKCRMRSGSNWVLPP